MPITANKLATYSLSLTRKNTSVIIKNMENTANLITENTKIKLLPKVKKERIWEIDFIRGFCVILMILDHLAFLLADFFGPSWYGGYSFYFKGLGDSFTRFCYEWINSSARDVLHPTVLFFFFSISGISCSFSHSNFKRGLELLAIALLYTLGSYAAQEMGIDGVFVAFGVLDFLAVCILLYAVIDWASKGNALIKCIISAIIIIVSACLYYLYNPPENTPSIFAIIFPPFNGQGEKALFYSQYDFSPGDLFTMIPYSAFYFAGVFLAPILYGKKRSLLPMLNGKWHKPVTFIGKHALIIYVVHVVILALILALISYLFITPGSFGI